MKDREWINSDVNVVLKAIVDHKGIIIDDHNGSERKIDFPILQVKKNGDSMICEGVSIKRNDLFCLNKIYVDDKNRPHLSIQSVGGIVEYAGCETDEEGLRKYNQEHLKNPNWSQEFITKINLNFDDK